jgi:hypothetical protein
MEPNKPNRSEENPFNGWLEKWKDLKPAPPRRDSLKAICWLAGFGAFLHPAFAFLPAKWPLLVMDGFLLLVVLIVSRHERNGHKNQQQ